MVYRNLGKFLPSKKKSKFSEIHMLLILPVGNGGYDRGSINLNLNLNSRRNTVIPCNSLKIMPFCTIL